MPYEILLEDPEGEIRLGWEDTREKAEEIAKNYIKNTDHFNYIRSLYSYYRI